MKITPQNPIAYFCAEYGLQSNLPLYAGGLGVLAGDTLKAAVDLSLPLVAIGLLYRGERAIQFINDQGMQEEKDMDFDPLSAGLEHVYLDNQPVFVRIHLTELAIWARVWKKTISDQVTLYLLDTDTDQNQLSERSITHTLYAGTEESVLKQQFILGMGGIKLLKILGIHPAVFHINEGRPAFIHWQLTRESMNDHGLSYTEASQLIKDKTVYTNHTLVAAGNNNINLTLLKRYAAYYAERMGIELDQLLEPGVTAESEEKYFSMTDFALRKSRRANGVSKLHTKLSKERWPSYDWVNVTNGVHLPTWQDQEVRQANLKTDELWHVHLKKKKELADFVLKHTGFSYDEKQLVITWAKRIAGYKRLDAIFRDLERLRSVLKNQEKPVQLLISGKAHLLDSAGKIRLQKIIKQMARELAGSAIFIPDYNLDIANKLVKGSDLWLNIPEWGKEACGTSGMKAISNGVLQATVDDGWANEVDWAETGWMIDSKRVSDDLYEKLEGKIIPVFYDRNAVGVPEQWLKMMKKSVSLAGQFGAQRMMKEYLEKLY
ncbi:MAG: alpha-glucan family phosphorylase [Candidatus Woesebacteria bacterium]|jgi:starch phosphorylase